MKRSKINYVVIVLLISAFGTCFISCTKEDEVFSEESNSVEDQTSYLLKDQGVKDAIECMGFQSKNVWVFANHYVVEDDIVVTKETVAANDCGKQTAVASNLTITIGNSANISYFIHPSVVAMNNGANWETAIRTAAADWTGIANSTINLQEVFNENAAELIIYGDNSAAAPATHRNLPANVWARASFPANGNVGNVMSINDVPPSNALTQNGRISILRHELGHCLGFHHSHIGDSSTTTILCNTNLNDPTSVMIASFNGAGTLNINANDQRAARALYPAFGNQFPTLSVTSGNYDRRRGTKGIHVTMTNDNGMDWHRIQIQRVDSNGTPYGNSIEQCAPLQGQALHRQFTSNFSRVRITFINHGEDAMSITTIYNNL
ncbi:M57 family metalloprotease [Kordia zhangzhouensis]|uniref:M57 family metalloprotease n=1 Tax=Kordia zhangzhouensis TaxID=1620405 RepID=UPI0006293608|nr:M57 family metalloprotease [Kordia zhangzhouensis]